LESHHLRECLRHGLNKAQPQSCKNGEETETAPQSKRHQGSDTEQQLVSLDSNQNLPYRAKATPSQAGLPDQTRELMQTACDPDVAAPEDQKLDGIEVDQNPEEKADAGMSLGIIRASQKDNYVERFWFECCMCEHLLNSAKKSCNKRLHECCEDCHAKRILSSEELK
jgi:hypothetical protein